MLNCTIAYNDASGEGDGAYARADDTPVLWLRNCILWFNGLQGGEQQNLRERGNTSVYLSYCDYDRALCSGEGITDMGSQITEDPLFADPANGDFHLKSEFGRWTPGGLVYDDVTSPCVDAGDRNDPCDGEPGGTPCRIDMGAYGGTADASGNQGGGCAVSGVCSGSGRTVIALAFAAA